MRKLSLWVVLFFILAMAKPLFAALNAIGLDDVNHFDVYISGYSGSSFLLKSVDIIGIREVQGRRFMVVRTDSFNAKSSEGLIAFESILAILPTDRSGPLQNLQLQPMQILPYTAPYLTK